MPRESEKISTLGSLSDKFSDLKVIAGGGGGVVLSGVDKSCSSSSFSDAPEAQQTNVPVALKRLSLLGKGHCRVALRELRLLKRFDHENLVKTIRITDANGSTIEDPSMENFKDLDSVYVVEELLDTDLHKIQGSNDKLPLDTTKLCMYQLLRGIKYIHSANVIHRDIKPGNLFINTDDLTLKIGDYGLARVFDDLYDHEGYLTALVSTRYYRAPEIMLNLGNYSFSIDIWSAGCVFGELLLNQVMFAGENDLDQLNVICEAFGIDQNHPEDAAFPEHRFEGIPPEAIDLLSKLLTIDPEQRITAEEALEHPFFSELHDAGDEPICADPFYIEHEIDNLPVKVLKQKILRNSCLRTVDKNSYHSSQEEIVFKDFDETFASESSRDHDRADRKRPSNNLLNSVGDDSSDMTTSSNSLDSGCCRDVGYLAYSGDEVKDEFIPSLKVAMDRGELNDEPYIDPGVCERKYHETSPTIGGSEHCSTMFANTDFHRSDINIQNHNISSMTCQESYFSDLSPVIDVYDRKSSETNGNEAIKSSFLGYHRHSNNDRGQFSTALPDQNTSKTKNSTRTQEQFRSSEQKIRENILSSSIGKSIKKSDNLRTMSQCPKTCRMEDILTKKLSDTHSSQLVHWDSLRFWI